MCKILNVTVEILRFYEVYITTFTVMLQKQNPKVENLIKQLFHSRLLDTRLVIANSALWASLAIYHLISNARPWSNC